jgi:type I restriction enzyme S subunit
MSKYESYTTCADLWNQSFPSHWNVVPMYAVAKVKSICNSVDLPLLSVYLDAGVVPFESKAEKRTNATSNDLSKYQRVDSGDFVLNNQQAWRGSVGVSFYTGIVSPAYIVLAMNNELDSKFANYLLRSRVMVDQYLINSKGVGSIQRNIYWTALKRTKIIVPPLDEQTKIVSFLDWKVSEVNRLIAIKKKQVTEYKELRKAVIDEGILHGFKKVEHER